VCLKLSRLPMGGQQDLLVKSSKKKAERPMDLEHSARRRISRRNVE